MFTFVLILFKINLIIADHLPWDRWMLDDLTPESTLPRRRAMGKADSIPYKAPSFDCECPPNDECKLNFEMDDKALDFLKISGLLKKHEEDQLRNHMLVARRNGNTQQKFYRRANGGVAQEKCCCPARRKAKRSGND